MKGSPTSGIKLKLKVQLMISKYLCISFFQQSRTNTFEMVILHQMLLEFSHPDYFELLLSIFFTDDMLHKSSWVMELIL